MIAESVKTYLEKKQITYMEGEGLVKIDVEGKRGSWQTYFRVVEEEGLLVIYSIFGYKVSQEKIQDVALLLTDINFGLKIGNFELNRSTGEIYFKTYLDLEGEEVKEEWIEKALLVNIHTMDHYLPEIMKATVEE